MLELWHWLKYVEPPLWLLVTLFVVPIGFQLGSSAPPWPGAIGWVTAVANIAIAIGLGRLVSRHPQSMNRTTVTIGILVAVFGSIAYLLLMSRFTFTIPTTGEVGVKGFFCTPEALAVYPDNCPSDDREALASAEFESSQIWQQWTIDIVRIGIISTWLGTFVALCWVAASIPPSTFGILLRKAPPPL